MNYFDYQILKEDEYKLINEQYEQTKNKSNQNIINNNANFIAQPSNIEPNTKEGNFNTLKNNINNSYSYLISVPKNLNKNILTELNNCLIFIKSLAKSFKINITNTNKSFNIFSLVKSLFEIFDYININLRNKNLSSLNKKLIISLLEKLETSNILFFKHM